MLHTTLTRLASSDSKRFISDPKTETFPSSIPTKAFEFITTSFPEASIERVIQKNKINPKNMIYAVNLSNGFEISFNEKGNQLILN